MKILLSVPYGLGFRNLVCAGVVDACLAAGAELTLLIPALPDEDAKPLRAEIPAGVDVAPLLPVDHGAWFTALKALKQHVYGVRTGLDSFAIRRQRRRHQRPAVHFAVTPLEWFGERVIPEALLDAALARTRQPHEGLYGRLLDRQRPDVVAVTKPGYMPEELPVIRAARSRRIPVIAVDTTWDNMASKRPPYLRPDAVTVWNSWMAGEAVQHYHFAPDTVAMTGGSQFDVLCDSARHEERGAFLSRLGLDPSRQLIVFSLNAPMYAPDNPGYLRMICEAIRSGAIAGQPNFIVRMHPFDRGESYQAVLAPYPNTRLERPFRLASPRSVYECLPTRADVAYYGSLMTHADVLINQASTTTLDALVTDTPVVNIAFDLAPTHAETSIRRVYDFTHYRRIVDSQAVTLAHGPEQLFAELSKALTDPGAGRAYRAQALDQFVGASDGAAATRVARAIMRR